MAPPQEPYLSNVARLFEKIPPEMVAKQFGPWIERPPPSALSPSTILLWINPSDMVTSQVLFTCIPPPSSEALYIHLLLVINPPFITNFELVATSTPPPLIAWFFVIIPLSKIKLPEFLTAIPPPYSDEEIL